MAEPVVPFGGGCRGRSDPGRKSAAAPRRANHIIGRLEETHPRYFMVAGYDRGLTPSVRVAYDSDSRPFESATIEVTRPTLAGESHSQIVQKLGKPVPDGIRLRHVHQQRSVGPIEDLQSHLLVTPFVGIRLA